MKIAYLILAHMNSDQLKRLVQRLQTDSTWIFVHLDLKAVNKQAFSEAIRNVRNTSFIYPEVDVKWGAYSVIHAILTGLRKITNSGVDFDYIHLMSGFDYPIKNNTYIFDFFSQNYGREFIHYRQLPIEELDEGRMDRIWYYYNFDNSHSTFGSAGSSAYETEMRQRGIKRSFIQGMKPYHGSMWWSLTGNCVKYILNLINENKEITNFFRYTKFPDEQFFQTLVMNSPFAQNVLNENLWYINWSGGSLYHPKTLDTGDFLALTSSAALYARKFNIYTDERILDMIDCHINHFNKYIS